nr:MAG TPA: hypothetical protein [Caudoviricetes sp.]
MIRIFDNVFHKAFLSLKCFRFQFIKKQRFLRYFIFFEKKQKNACLMFLNLVQRKQGHGESVALKKEKENG